jgi:hypothetical protein
MIVNSVWKAIAIRYGAIALLAGGLFVGSVVGASFAWQKFDNRSQEGNQATIDAKYLHPAQEAHKRGDLGAYEKLMEQYHRANERNYAD